MRLFLIFLPGILIITGCLQGFDGTSTPSSIQTPAVTSIQASPTHAIGRPTRTPNGLAVDPGGIEDRQELEDPWESGGPGEVPKPTDNPVILSTPGYLKRLEPQLPSLAPPLSEADPTRSVDEQDVGLGASGEQPSAILLPDLYTLPPYDLRLVRDDSTGRMIVRFSNAIANLGPGALELRGNMDSQSNIVDVLQRIFTAENEDDFSYMEAGVGQFHYHPEHEHWHWDGFSLYEVYAVLADGSLGELIYTSDKVGYCLRDDGLIENSIEGDLSPYPAQVKRYGNCGPSIQGLSVGWSDIYAHDTPGQWVDVTGLPEGEVFALRSTADPHQRVHEIDKANNSAVVYFRLLGTQVEMVENW